MPAVGAGGDQRLAVLDEGAYRRGDDGRLLGELAERRRVGDIRGDGLDRGAGLPEPGQPFPDAVELGRVAAGDRPAQVVGAVSRETLGGQTSREAGRPEEDHVVRPSGARGCVSHALHRRRR